MHSVRWQDWSGAGLEHCMCNIETEGLTLEGVVAGMRLGLYGGHYLVRTDAAFHTREVRVAYLGGPVLHVTSDGAGHWQNALTGQELSELEGCHDVDVGITPATNTLPIKRLQLVEGERRDIAAAYVPLPDQITGAFLPQRAEQRYTCLVRDRRYLYEGLFRAFSAELEVDAAGLVIDYPETFRRVPC